MPMIMKDIYSHLIDGYSNNNNHQYKLAKRKIHRTIGGSFQVILCAYDLCSFMCNNFCFLYLHFIWNIISVICLTYNPYWQFSTFVIGLTITIMLSITYLSLYESQIFNICNLGVLLDEKADVLNYFKITSRIFHEICISVYTSNAKNVGTYIQTFNH